MKAFGLYEEASFRFPNPLGGNYSAFLFSFQAFESVLKPGNEKSRNQGQFCRWDYAEQQSFLEIVRFSTLKFWCGMKEMGCPQESIVTASAPDVLHFSGVHNSIPCIFV